MVRTYHNPCNALDRTEDGVPKRVDHDERRREIVRALWRITERGGLGAVSFREVAAEAGVSVRLVQYYFGTKLDLLREANRQALQTMGARIARRALAAMDGDPSPRDVVATIAREFLPADSESRRAMLLYYAFYTAQMTDPDLRGAGEVPRGFIDLVADQIRRSAARRHRLTERRPRPRGRRAARRDPGRSVGRAHGLRHARRGPGAGRLRRRPHVRRERRDRREATGAT